MIINFLAQLQRLWQLRWQALSEDSREFFARLRMPMLLLVIVIMFGTWGYKHLWLEHNGSWSDAFFMTIITITTIGYGEVLPLNDIDRIFTIWVSIIGIGSLSYVFASSMEFIVARQLSDSRKNRRMKRMISQLSNHTIVAGYGRMGHWVVHELKVQQEPFVIVDVNERSQSLPHHHEKDYLYISGDASDDHILKEAGIDRARCLVAVAANDAANAFVIMSARVLNPDLYIIARSEQQTSVEKLQRAGANSVVNPYAFGGRRLVQQLLYPAAIDFMAHATERNDALNIEEFHIPHHSPLVGKNLRELNIRQKYNVNIIGLLRSLTTSQRSTHASPLFIPTGTDIFVSGDLIIVAGAKDDITRFSKFINKQNDND